MSKVGLVTTFRFVPTAVVPDEEGQATVERCWSALSSFLLFHLAKGVEHIFLYADAAGGSNQIYVGQSRFGRWGLWCVVRRSTAGSLCAVLLPGLSFPFLSLVYLRKVLVDAFRTAPTLLRESIRNKCRIISAVGAQVKASRL